MQTNDQLAYVAFCLLVAWVSLSFPIMSAKFDIAIVFLCFLVEFIVFLVLFSLLELSKLKRIALIPQKFLGHIDRKNYLVNLIFQKSKGGSSIVKNIMESSYYEGFELTVPKI